MASPSSGQLPNGIDWADGQLGRVGTLTTAGVIQIQSSAGVGAIPIEEVPGYPTIECGEQATIVHKFTMSWAEALTQILFYQRGTILADDEGNVTRVLTSSISRTRGGPDPFQTWAEMTITCEAISFDTPPDLFRVTEVELGINIIKYPRYFYAFNDPNANNALLNQDVIRWLQNYFENTNSAYRDALTFMLYYSLGNPGNVSGSTIFHAAPVNVTLADSSTQTMTPIAGTDLAKNAALEIIQKYWRNEETPYIVGYDVEWDSFNFRPVYINPGGYVENPITQATPQLPDYFWSPADPPDSTTIFDNLSEYNPQCYSSTGVNGGPVVLSWLRKSDRQVYERTWFKITRHWIGSPVGFWDSDLYTSGNRPDGVSVLYDVQSIPCLKQADWTAAKNAGMTLFQ